MACSLRSVNGGVYGSGLNLNESRVIPITKQAVSGFCPISVISENKQSKSKLSPVSSLEMKESHMLSPNQKDSIDLSNKTLANFPAHAQTTSIGISRAMRWWEKTLKPNMVEIHSAQHLENSLLNAGDRLVMVDFYSPGCGGCKSLHPKICQLAESNPDVMFVKVNHEELRTMCHSLHVHVLPFFRLYRGAEGRLCSFSCTISTIKKLKDALAKHGTERCSLGPAKGLEEKELMALASAGELELNLPLPLTKEEETTMEGLLMQSTDLSHFFSKNRR